MRIKSDEIEKLSEKKIEQIMGWIREANAEIFNRKPFEPKIYDTYYYLDSEGDACVGRYDESDSDEYRILSGNCFKTIDNAEDYKKYLLTKRQLEIESYKCEQRYPISERTAFYTLGIASTDEDDHLKRYEDDHLKIYDGGYVRPFEVRTAEKNGLIIFTNRDYLEDIIDRIGYDIKRYYFGIIDSY